MQNFLFTRYKSHFNKKRVAKVYNKLRKRREARAAREEAERRRREAQEIRRIFNLARLTDLANMRARGQHPRYRGHFFLWAAN